MLLSLRAYSFRNQPIMSLLLLLVMILLLPVLVSCNSSSGSSGIRTYYISPSGDDDNSGLSPEQAWKSLERVNRQDLEPGDAVLFEGGAGFQGMLELNTGDSATADNPMLLSSYGAGRATINGGNGMAFKAEKCDYFTLRNLRFTGSGRKSGNQSDGVYIAGCASFHIDSLEITGFQHSGLSIFQCNDVRITQIYAHENGFAGIHVFGTTIWEKDEYDNHGVYIARCVAENNPGDPTVTNNHSGNGILASSVQGGVIEYCESFNNGYEMPWTGNGPVGIWIWDCTEFIIQHCISHDNKTAVGAADGGGFDLDGGVSNAVIQYCLSYNNQGPGIGLFEFGAGKVWENNIVRYNISQNDGTNGQGSLAVWKGESGGTIRNCEIYNNTFYNSEGPNLCFMNNWTGFSFTNNVFVYNGSILVKGKKIAEEQFRHNLYWNVNGQTSFLGFESIEKWALATGKEMNNGVLTGLYADPMLRNPGTLAITDPLQLTGQAFIAYLPGDHSPLIDAALELREFAGTSAVTTDIAGTSIPQGTTYDIGALEYH